MSEHFDLIVIGAGPAGSATAIAAVRRGLRVLLLEAGRFPRHKVCGEFVSAESADVLRYLLGESANAVLDAPRITRARLHSSGHSVEIAVEPAAYSIPRYRLDEYLWQAAIATGIECRNETATEVLNTSGQFSVSTRSCEYHATSVINASGRWSKLGHRVVGNAWVGLKAHFRGDTDEAVHLYFTKDGYLGVQAVSPGVLNACALVRQGAATNLNEVFAKDPEIRARTKNWVPVTETFATAPVYLGAGAPVANGMWQVGDAAGFVDPFVGDGISLALRSGVLAGRAAGMLTSERYAELYRESFAQVFRSTGRVRKLLGTSRVLLPALVKAFQVPLVSRGILSTTRRPGLDILGIPIG